jgi:hypothetical protein
VVWVVRGFLLLFIWSVGYEFIVFGLWVVLCLGEGQWLSRPLCDAEVSRVMEVEWWLDFLVVTVLVAFHDDFCKSHA